MFTIIKSVLFHYKRYYMKLNIKAGVSTTRKPASHVISVRVDENVYNICNMLAAEEQRTLSQMGRILLQKGLEEVTSDQNPRRAKG
jgi:hypothetical protein